MMKFLDLCARRGVYYASYCFFKRRIERDGCGGVGGRGLFEELGACEQEFAVELEDLVEFGGDVATDDVFDAYSCGLEFADLGTCQCCCCVRPSGSASKRMGSGAGVRTRKLRKRAAQLPGHRSISAYRKRTHLKKLRHLASLLFRLRCVFLLHHAQP